MKILVEGEKYNLNFLREIFDNPIFYSQEGESGRLISVGYYHSYRNSEIIYMLPKVFMVSESLSIFGLDKTQLINLDNNQSFEDNDKYEWIRHISVFFYNSLLEFRLRNLRTSILNNSLTAGLNTNIDESEYSYLDLLLSFVNFYKKNKEYINFKKVDYKSKKNEKVNWEKTVRKSIPLLTKKKQPIYNKFRSKGKSIDTEDQLMVYFFSILNYFDNQHNLNLNIRSPFNLIKGSSFTLLQKNGLIKLRKIKYKYFNDTSRKIYNLCELYFSKTDTSSRNKMSEDFISVNNYNLVFEDMIDKLFSDSIQNYSDGDGNSLKQLKNNKDGKVIDHLFSYQSLFDTSNIFYIGDSKYYKPENLADKISKYKQFTYAKNIIQYNIDIFNNKGDYYPSDLKYRDEITEGYNITPNFFIYAYIKDYRNFDESNLEEKDEIIKSSHFEYRLFDRDTLFIHQYKINFLYVLKAYSQINPYSLEKFREKSKKTFRDNFISFFSKKEKCKYQFFIYRGSDIKHFVNTNFRILNGKCFQITDNKLIVAKHIFDDSIKHLVEKYLDKYDIVDND